MSDTGFDGQGITSGTGLILSPASPLPPASLFTPTPKAARRVLEFFTAQINKPHTRRAYLSAARRFDAWCEGRGTDVQADGRRAWWSVGCSPLCCALHEGLAGEINPTGARRNREGGFREPWFSEHSYCGRWANPYKQPCSRKAQIESDARNAKEEIWVLPTAAADQSGIGHGQSAPGS